MEVVAGNAKVQCIAEFKMDGTPQVLARQKQNTDAGVFDDRISVRVNSGMGVDAVEGKAKRKFFAWVYDRLTGVVTDTPEGEVGDGDTPTSKELIPSAFKGGPVKEEKPSEDDGCPLIVAEYRAKFSGIAEKPEIGKLMAMAGRDARLTPKAKSAVAAMATEATKLWPKKLDGGEESATSAQHGSVNDSYRPKTEEKSGKTYAELITECTASLQVAKVELRAKGDKSLSAEDCQMVLDMCTARRNELSNGGGK
jgi:hypothetical protein